MSRKRLESKAVDRAVGVAVSVAMLAGITGLVFALEPLAPVLSLGVLYVVAVVAVALLYGLAYAIPVSLASMLGFNWFFLPPRHTFALRDSGNWVALAVYLVTAVVVSELATRSRRRASDAEQREREATALADVSAQLLQGQHVQDELRAVAGRIAEVLRVPKVRIELDSVRRPDADERAVELVTADRRVGQVVVAREEVVDVGAVSRFLPGLASLLAVALERERLGRKAVEAETFRRSDAVKTAVLQAVSHDLRSPLTAIRAAIDGIGSGTLELDDADRRSLLETISDETARLERLISKLIDLSRLQAGAATPRPELWTADSLIARSLDALGPAGDRIVVELPDEPPAMLVDAGHIERVLVNVFENALKFSGADETVNVSVAEVGDVVQIRVVDHGPGLEPGEAERIFEPFQQGRPQTLSGSGLGLAIARGFAQANGGDVWAESQPGQGARFVVALPLAKQAAAAR